jgi:DNA-binding NarL/FixJ family response regulator
MSVRVLLVDDHVMFRQALRVLLENAPDMEIVGEAGDGSQVEDLVNRLEPDVVVIDVAMPIVGGTEATAGVMRRHPQLKVIALSASVQKRFVLEMLDAGVLGYISKLNAGEELLHAIRQVSRGERYLCTEASATLIEVSQRNKNEGRGRENTRLGRREREILCLLADGKTTPTIAETLHIAPSTVTVHRRNIMRKVDLHNVADLTKYAIREGIILA